MAQRNAQDGISLVQTAEGALSEVHSLLGRMRDLRVQYSNETLSADDKKAIESEVVALKDEIADIKSDTAFNSVKLFDGGSGGSVEFLVGATSGETISASTSDLFAASTAPGLSEANGITSANVGTNFASLQLEEIDNAIEEISTRRSNLGAVQNRLEHRLTNLSAYQENLVASESASAT
jgi:flagellin